MSNLFRRHSPKCKHRDKKRGYTKCSCPIWADIRIGKQRFLKSVKLRDWSRAEKRVAQWLQAPEKSGLSVTIADAIKAYLAECKSCNLKDSTIDDYRVTLESFAAFNHNVDIDQLTMESFTKWRSRGGSAASTGRKQIGHLRAFCEFAHEHKWIAENFAKKLRLPKDDRRETLPFTDAEITALIQACDKLTDDNPERVAHTRALAKARILVMLYTGFRVSDTVTLAKAHVDVNTGRTLIRAKKVDKPVYVRIPPVVIAALQALHAPGKYFFWNGESQIHTACNVARVSLKRVAAIAGVADVRPHRFRDTFSVKLLTKGKSLRTVQMLLGHTSMRTTEKYYAPFVPEFQKMMDEAVESLDFLETAEAKSDTIKDTKW